MSYIGLKCQKQVFNSFWPSDPIWRQRSGSTLVQVMACCLTAPSQYLNQCGLIWSSVKFSGIHIRIISQEMPQPSTTKIHLKMTYLKFHSNFPGANELTQAARDHSGYGVDQWEKALLGNASYYWRIPYTERSLIWISHDTPQNAFLALWWGLLYYYCYKDQLTVLWWSNFQNELYWLEGINIQK